MVIDMKKTVSLLLAVLFAAIAICTMAIGVFAAEDGKALAANDDPANPYAAGATTKAPATAAPTTAAPTAAPTTAAPTAAPTTAVATLPASTLAPDIEKTNAPGQTAIDDGPETKAPKAPAKVISDNPSTGSSIAAPAVALLALAAGVTVVVKTKKDED